MKNEYQQEIQIALFFSPGLFIPELQGVFLQDPMDMWLMQLLFQPNHHLQNVQKGLYPCFPYDFPIPESFEETVKRKKNRKYDQTLQTINLKQQVNNAVSSSLDLCTNLFVVLISIKVN